ncbi:hypothetical protein GCM10023091_38980 [Ravibacter arvi]|uniref:Glycosyl transferase family 1 domain-containing protein n=1 Tax=Ravibacter arvi TaxID=2051041 RepID=A0ABP8MBF1_9BACT
MRILVVHNQLWAHYKSKLFEEIYRNLLARYPSAVFKVAQISLYESARASMQPSDAALYEYPYEVLFRKSLDQITLLQRVRALFRAYNDFKPTVLNITGYYDWAQVLLMCYAKLKGTRIVLSSESSALDHQRNPVKETIKKWIVNRADAYFCFGTTSVAYLKLLGVPENKISVRHGAVIDDERVKQTFMEARRQNPVPQSNFIFVGRFSPEKNLMTLLRVYAKIRAGRPDSWGLLLVGDGPERKQLESYANREIGDSVVFSGGISWQDVPKWLAKAGALVLPSTSEPWGLVVNEALVCGLPVVVSDQCGCVEDLVHDGGNGYIFSPLDSDRLEACMLRLMDASDDTTALFSQNGRNLVNKFASGKVAGEMVTTFAELGSHTDKK